MIKQKKLSSLKVALFASLLLLIITFIIIATLELFGVTHISKKHVSQKVTGVTGASQTKGVKSIGTPSKVIAQTNQDSQNNENAANANKPVKTPDSPAAAQLIAPWGTFVNQHNVTQYTTLGSVCNTTPGATCQIFFTNDTTTKSLPAKTSDAGGAVYWSAWRPNDQNIGLTPGVWHITATATLGGQTQTTDNSTPDLVISS